MKKLLFLIFILFSLSLTAQNYNPIINYHFNGTPTNGIKIQTNIPYSQGHAMPTLVIEGYEYLTANSIGLTLSWHVYGGNFIRYFVSSHGGATPEIKLFNEGGKVVIFINDKKFFSRFTIRGYTKGNSLADEHFENWAITDDLPAATATNEVTLPYKNKFAGNITFPNGIWDEDGNVGIGTSSPQATLHLNGDFYANMGEGFRIFGDGDYFGTYKDAIVFQMEDINSTNGATDGGFVFRGYSKADKVASDEWMVIKNGGNVGIGTTDTFDYKLAVNGTIGAKKVKVEIASAWPDYVFAKGYELPTLKEVEKHITKKGHLENIPSAKEVKENGIDLGDMNKQLLQKIEELTLYTIQQEKKIEKLENENKLFKKLELRIQKLEDNK